ncbi:Rv1733c family protein [Streptomyces olivochromogenes]|uniref:Rv1733c family protein n=1 Tax=Streptomyces olivochromogenes TaxID=1963 RepID=UPI001F2A9A42|nr:hypothetical protein [Streptomyces olivochromogenes]MCF3131846.1 hypothetical protein [Streptomyces olivochromogenes]
MRGGRSLRSPLWRWRSNPLRRHDDIVEAWIVLAVWLTILLGGAVAGFVTAHAASESFARQRAERHSVRAVLVTDVPRTLTETWGTGDQVRATVRWTAPDGTSRTARTWVEHGAMAGTAIVVWQDDNGRLTPSPTGPGEAALESAVLGLVAAGALAGLSAGAGAVVRARLDRRRMDEWGREWDLVGPRWGHRTG